jgi:rod shape-determining protein MreC
MRKSSKSYFILVAVLLFTMSIPLATSEWFREIAVSVFSPIYELFDNEENVLSPESLPLKEAIEGHEPTVEALAARIIFRSPNSWNSSMWINVGSENNQDYETVLVAKNSPVLVGDSVVGVIDYVGKKQSRVRLITDSGLVPSVRVARGLDQNKAVHDNVKDLISYLGAHPELFEKQQDKVVLENNLKALQRKLLEKKQTWYLAKGEIQGQSHPLWRANAHVLRGSGFNYNFEDEQGPARDLRSGEPINGAKNLRAMPLVKVDDLLVTTGMDGVFPAGLKVATVTKIDLLREGDYAYELEAKPTVGNLDELSWVYVIAPLGYDENDQPPIR